MEDKQIFLAHILLNPPKLFINHPNALGKIVLLEMFSITRIYYFFSWSWDLQPRKSLYEDVSILSYIAEPVVELKQEKEYI